MVQVKKSSRLAVLALMSALISHVAYAQGSEPPWVREAWRSAHYPSGVWYVGFSQNTLPPKSNAAEYLKNLERDALNKMVESISVRVSGASAVENTNYRERQDGKGGSRSSSDYRQKIEASASAEIANSEVRSYHDPQAGKIYAFAAVRKSDLASYYVSRVDYHVQRAENAISEAKQLARLDKKGEALKKNADAKGNLDECAQYLKLLSAVDYESGGARRLLARETALRQEISAVEAELEESMSFYVDGTETLGGAKADIVISKLKSAISKDGYRLAGDPASAGYILHVEVNDCNVRSAANYTFCNACVRAEAINVKTEKSAGRIDFTGSKQSWQDGRTACVKAFEVAASELWGKVKETVFAQNKPLEAAYMGGGEAYAVSVPAPVVKETVAVYIAGKENKESQGMHAVLGGELVKAISASGKYVAVDRTAHVLAVLEKEHIKQRDGSVDDRQLRELGKQLAAKYMCIAAVKPVSGGVYYLDLRLVDVETAVAVTSVTESSTLEDIGEMRRVALLLGHKLIGNESEAAALAAVPEQKSFEPAPDPITAKSRRAEAKVAAAPSASSASSYSGSYSYGSSSPERTFRYSWETEEDTQTQKPESSASSRDSKPDSRDGGIRWGGRLALSTVFAGAQSNSGSGWLESESSGEFLSAGLAMSVPVVANALSLNAELLLDVRRLNLSVALQLEDGSGIDLRGSDAVMEYVLCLPLSAKYEVSYFFVEAGLRFDYALSSDLAFADDEREQINMGGIAGAGFAFKLSLVKCYLGYRFEGDVTRYDEKGYFRFYRHSVGLTLLY